MARSRGGNEREAPIAPFLLSPSLSERKDGGPLLERRAWGEPFLPLSWKGVEVKSEGDVEK